jgi:hypothetical protein
LSKNKKLTRKSVRKDSKSNSQARVSKIKSKGPQSAKAENQLKQLRGGVLFAQGKGGGV